MVVVVAAMVRDDDDDDDDDGGRTWLGISRLRSKVLGLEWVSGTASL